MMTIEERLENMERELGRQKQRNRWLLGTILVVVGGLITPVLFKTTPLQARAQSGGTVKELRANRIVLEDENGKTSAGLSILKDGPALAPLDDHGRRDILEILEDRHEVRSTIVTSQLPVAAWHEMIGDPTLADAILDRLVHNAYKIDLKGDSMRKRLKSLTQSGHSGT